MTYRNPRMDQAITDLMEFDHVVAVMPDGRVIDTDERYNLIDVYAPEVLIDYDGPFTEAQIGKSHDAAMVAYLRDQGWEVLTGYSGQYLYSGPVMHPSEFIGGRLEERIREESGFWVKLSVEIHPGEDDPEHESNGGSGESEAAGWIVARKIGSQDEIAARTQWVAEDLAPRDVDPRHKNDVMLTDEDAAMSAPEVFYKGESESKARLSLINHLNVIANYRHVKQAGKSAIYLDAATDMQDSDTYSVKVNRIFRVRALLMPKESK